MLVCVHSFIISIIVLYPVFIVIVTAINVITTYLQNAQVVHLIHIFISWIINVILHVLVATMHHIRCVENVHHTV